MKKIFITGIALLGLLGATMGCTGAGVDESVPSIDSISAELVSPQIATTNATQEGMRVRIDISVSDFDVVDTIGDNITAGDNVTAGQGDGYFIYYLDRLPAALQEEVPEFAQTSIRETPASPEAAYSSTETTFTWENLTTGVHIFSVQLVDVDGAPLLPPVVAAAAITVPVVQQETAPETEQPATQEEQPPTQEGPGVLTTTATLTVDDTGFNMTEITLPAGAEITINLQNDGQAPHNFSLYQTQAALIAIFTGDTVQAGESMTYSFTAPPEPGKYYFQDDENPGASGDFIVEEAP